MLIRTCKRLYRKIQVVNNIHRQIQFLTGHTQCKKNMPYRCQSKFYTSPTWSILRHVGSGRSFLRLALVRTAVLRLALVRDAVLRHTLVGTHFYDIPWSERIFLRHTLVGTQFFYDLPLSGRSFTTYPDRDAFSRHTLVGT